MRMVPLTDRIRRLHAPDHAQAIAFALMLVGAVAAAIFFIAAQDASRWARHALAVEVRLSATETAMLRAEMLRHDHFVTGDPRQRAGALAASARAAAMVAGLEASVSDNPVQRRNVARLRQAVERRLNDIRDAMALRARDPDAATALVGAANERAGIASLAAAQHAVAQTERRLFAARTARTGRLERLGIATLAAGSAALVLLTLLVWHDRRRRVDALHRANRELAADVALRRQIEAQLEMLATNASDAVLRIAPDGSCLYASPSARDVLGVGTVALVGRRLVALVERADRDAVAAGLDRLVRGISTGERITARPRRTSADDDAPRWLEATTRAVIDPATGDTREIIAAVRDVSAFKTLEIELKAARLRAEAAAMAKTTFLANMSHEIRTPMNGVIGFTDLVLDGDLSPAQRRRVETIAESGRSMMRLLNDILDLSKIEAGAMTLSDEDVDVRAILRGCADLMEPVVRQKGVALHIRVDEAVPAMLAGDPLRLRQILLNLIGNAAKFTAAGSAAVDATIRDDRLRIAVRDTGIGIAPDRLARIFHQFEQADGSTARRFGGSGLGLAISARLAAMMHGGIAVESVEGEGSVFTLDLPALARTPFPSADVTPDAPAAVRPAQALRVLVAEDHDINRQLMTAMLERLGIAPVLVADGAAAVDAVGDAAARGEAFDIVLMDVQMPGVDGLEATRRLRAAGHGADTLPVVALTAHAFAEDVSACRDAGMQAHLTKPVHGASLADTIARLTRRAMAPAVPASILTPGMTARHHARRAQVLTLLERMATAERIEPASAQEAMTLLHKLAGTAAFFGDAATGEWAGALERRLPHHAAAHDTRAIRRALDALACPA